MFAVNHAFPFSKMLTFYRKEPFDLEACYGKNVNLPLKDGFIGKSYGSSRVFFKGLDYSIVIIIIITDRYILC